MAKPTTRSKTPKTPKKRPTWAGPLPSRGEETPLNRPRFVDSLVQKHVKEQP
jgi:hypothetical protein